VPSIAVLCNSSSILYVLHSSHSTFCVIVFDVIRVISFLDDEAACSGADDEEEGDRHHVDEESLGSLADVIAEPSSEELQQAGLSFQSESDEDEKDVTAILRERRPFNRFRRIPEPRSISTPLSAAAAAAVAASDPSDDCDNELPSDQTTFHYVASGCKWLTEIDLLHDAAKSAEQLAEIAKGYAHDKAARRQARGSNSSAATGLLELTSCVNYCVHILTVRLGLQWAGGTPAPGEKSAGLLMRPVSEYGNVVCEEITVRGEPMDIAQVIHNLVLAHPANFRWRDLVIGRRLYKVNDLIYLVQMGVSSTDTLSRSRVRVIS
jgi:hypothetical protein